MIVAVYPHNGREDRIRHYSDSGMMLLQTDTGNLYSDAIDVFPTEHLYEETDIPIAAEEPEVEEI